MTPPSSARIVAPGAVVDDAVELLLASGTFDLGTGGQECGARLCKVVKDSDGLAERPSEPGAFAYDKAIFGMV